MGRLTKELFGNKEERGAAREERLAERSQNNAALGERLAEIRGREAEQAAERQDKRAVARQHPRRRPSDEERMFKRAYQLSTITLWLYAVSILVPVVVVVGLLVWLVL